MCRLASCLKACLSAVRLLLFPGSHFGKKFGRKIPLKDNMEKLQTLTNMETSSILWFYKCNAIGLTNE